MCIHVIIIAVDLKKAVFPDQSKNIQIPHNTKRGQKPKTKKALNKQKDLESSRSFRSTDTSEYLERVTGKCLKDFINMQVKK